MATPGYPACLANAVSRQGAPAGRLEARELQGVILLPADLPRNSPTREETLASVLWADHSTTPKPCSTQDHSNAPPGAGRTEEPADTAGIVGGCGVGATQPQADIWLDVTC